MFEEEPTADQINEIISGLTHSTLSQLEEDLSFLEKNSDKLTKEEVEEICYGIVMHFPLFEFYNVKSLLKKILEKNKDKVDKETYEDIMEYIDFSREEKIEIINEFLQYKNLFNRSLKYEKINGEIVDEKYAAMKFGHYIHENNFIHASHLTERRQMIKRYGKEIEEISKEKLDLEEIMIIALYLFYGENFSYTFIEGFLEEDVYVNLLKRMEEIKDSIENPNE